MINNIDIILRELRKKIENNDFVILAQECSGVKSQIEFTPVDYEYNLNGLTITDKNGYYFSIDEEYFELYSDDTGECLEFSYRDKEHGNYFGITF